MARVRIETEGLIDYKIGTDTELWVSPTTLTRARPALLEFALSIYGMDLTGATPVLNLGLDAATPLGTDIRLPNKFRVRTDDGQVFVVDASAFPIDPVTSTRFVPVGTTALPILLPEATAITFGAISPTRTIANYNEYLPFYSAAESSFKADGEEINYRNYGEGVYDIARKSKMKLTFDSSGYFTPGDSILNVIRRCSRSTTESIAVRYIPPDDQALEFICDVKSDDRSTKVDEGYMVKFSYSITKAPVEIDLTPS